MAFQLEAARCQVKPPALFSGGRVAHPGRDELVHVLLERVGDEGGVQHPESGKLGVRDLGCAFKM